MDKFHIKKMMNETEKAKRALINRIKHKLQFGGLNTYDQSLARGLLKMGVIGQRYVCPRYQHLLPVGA